MIMYRKMALPFVGLFIKLKISPNFITTLTLFCALLTFCLILRHAFFQAAFTWQLVPILDVCDGMVARRTGKTSSFGEWYDYIVDRVNFFLLLVAMGIVVGHPVGWWLTTCSIMLSYLTDISSLKGISQAKQAQRSGGRAKAVAYASSPLWRRFVESFVKNFININIHIWGFIGLPLLFGINGVRFSMFLITGILFLNVVNKIRGQIMSNINAGNHIEN